MKWWEETRRSGTPNTGASGPMIAPDRRLSRPWEVGRRGSAGRPIEGTVSGHQVDRPKAK